MNEIILRYLTIKEKEVKKKMQSHNFDMREYAPILYFIFIIGMSIITLVCLGIFYNTREYWPHNGYLFLNKDIDILFDYMFIVIVFFIGIIAISYHILNEVYYGYGISYKEKTFDFNIDINMCIFLSMRTNFNEDTYILLKIDENDKRNDILRIEDKNTLTILNQINNYKKNEISIMDRVKKSELQIEQKWNEEENKMIIEKISKIIDIYEKKNEKRYDTIIEIIKNSLIENEEKNKKEISEIVSDFAKREELQSLEESLDTRQTKIENTIELMKDKISEYVDNEKIKKEKEELIKELLDI